MSLEIEDQCAPDHPIEANHESPKKANILYSRDFLLSLSELDVCKKLPSGFDLSILSEFNDSFNNLPDRQRIPGSYSLQSFKCGEYGSSPPARGDSSNYSRGIHGRWDSRSSGQGDGDCDSHSDWDAESGKRYGNQSRWFWKNSEHDGLLGSGSFPRPSGYAAAPKVRANDHYQLNRSTELDPPPHPYKAVPHSRRGVKDSYNDETFGSSDCTSQDRAEEERRRRDSFELMRKELKELQEKQKLNPDQHKVKLVSNVSFLPEVSKDDKEIVNVDIVLDESQIEPGPQNGPEKSYYSSQAPASRPLVPPGFTSGGLGRNFGTKPSNLSLPLEDVGNLQHQDNPLRGTSLNCEVKKPAQNMGLEVSNELNRMNDGSYKTSSVLEACDILEDSEIIKLDAEKGSGHKIVSELGQDQSTLALNKLFGTALTINNGGTFRLIENHNAKEDEMGSPKIAKSSRFAHWFLEEEKKTVDDYSSSRPSDLLSLIVGGNIHGVKVSDVESAEQIQPAFPLKCSDPRDKHITSDVSSSTAEISEQFYTGNKSDEVSAVLRCEDLEQSILSEISENSTNLHSSIQDLVILDAKTEQPRASSDDYASQHLLSLLQKGATLQEIAPSPNLDMVYSDKLHVLEAENGGTALKFKQENSVKLNNSENTPTLETFFGSAFMKELQDSVGSARIDVSEPHGLSSSVVDDGLLLHSVDNGTRHGSNVLPSTNRRKNKLGNMESHWLGFDDPRNEMDPMNLRTEVGSKNNDFDTEVESRLPEEESLLGISDPLNAAGSSFIPSVNATKAQLLSLPNASVGIAEKIAALNAALKDERHMLQGQEGPPFLFSPYDLLESEIPRQNLLHPQSSPQFNPQMNHGRPLFQPFDSHAAQLNPQLKFMFPESSTPQGAPPNQIPGNMLRPHFQQHPSTGLSGFDPRGHYPMLHQMRMPGNFSHSDLLRGLARGSPVPPQQNNHATGFLKDSNIIHGFQYGHQNPNFGIPEIPLPARDGGGGSNNPEVLQRLLQMEFRSNPKQMNPFPIAEHTQGLHDDELEKGFRYR